MRNEIFMDLYAEKICDFNYNVLGREKVEKYLPRTSLYGYMFLDNWAPDV